MRRERRRLGRFVAFTEIDADLRPILLFDQVSASKYPGVTPGQLSDSGSAPEEV